MRRVAGLFTVTRGYVPRVLLVFKNGYWFFPGGKQEVGESLLETLAREVAEELSLSFACIPVLLHQGVFEVVRGTTYQFSTYTCRSECLIGMPKLRPTDTVKDFAWVDEPLGLNLTPHARFIISQFGAW